MDDSCHKPCYITLAVSTVLNRSDDDCYELSAFRGFRDKFLRNEPDGEELIDEYYRTTPKIVEAIDERSDAEQIYCQIWEDYLSLCLEEIEEGDYKACKKRYIRMIRSLQEEYL
jgi:hypothetical protein